MDSPIASVAPIPVTHQDHPFWQGFTWEKLVHALQAAAAIAPVVVAIVDKKDPEGVKTAQDLSALTGAVLERLGS